MYPSPTAFLPLSLLFLCVTARQPQCRLVPHAFYNRNPQGTYPTTTSTGTSPGSSSTSGFTEIPFDYNKDVIRGVNLGGWFVLEPWITPSIFEGTNNDAIIDEYTFGQMQDYDKALAVLKDHWETWITERDLDEIRDAGLNHVRIPLGYWSVPLSSSDTNTSTSVSPYIPGAWPYFLRALNWCKARSIRTIVDIHGVPGSQNGYDNSGQRTNTPQWADNPDNVTRTIDTLRFIVESVGGLIDVIELVNEPAGFKSAHWADTIRQFWQDGYDAVRQAAGGGIKVMIGDAFLGVKSWTNFLTYPDHAQGVMMDFHEYQIFSNLELSRSFEDHIKFACTNLTDLEAFNQENLYTVVGEWSTAPTDCAKWLNGRGIGARWEGKWYGDNQVFGTCSNMTGSYTNFSPEYREFLRKYWEVQVEVGESVKGWVYWTWKAEEADEWSYQKGLQGGWIPQNPQERKYPGICP